MMKVLFKTEDGVDKHVGDAYYCVQNGTKGSHHYPFKVQLVKMENKTEGTHKKEFDSRLSLNDPGIKRFHNKKLAKAWSKYIIILQLNTIIL